MDKAVMKVLFQARGLKVCDWVVVMRRDWRSSPSRVLDAIARALDAGAAP
jgi:D-alanine-D-alanine ligase-like ATP-grasp enzyme